MHWNDWDWWRETPLRVIGGLLLLLLIVCLICIFIIFVLLPLLVPALVILILSAIVVGVVRNRFWPPRGSGH